MEESKNNIEKLKELLEDVNYCMMIVEDGGKLSGRPMSINKVEEDGSLWFFTKKTSFQVSELKKDANVAIAIVDSEEDSYLMINGIANLIDNQQKIEELWSPILKAWFPKGPEDNEILLIQVVPKDADYWKGNSSKIAFAFNIVKSLVTGEQYSDGEHGSLKL